MAKFIRKVLVTALGLWAAAGLVDGISASGFEALLLGGLVLGLVNAVVRPIVVLLTLPITFLTLGLFLFLINGAMLLLVGRFVDGIEVASLGAATLGAIIVGLISWLVGDEKPVKQKGGGE